MCLCKKIMGFLAVTNFAATHLRLILIKRLRLRLRLILNLNLNLNLNLYFTIIPVIHHKLPVRYKREHLIMLAFLLSLRCDLPGKF